MKKKKKMQSRHKSKLLAFFTFEEKLSDTIASSFVLDL